MIKGVGIDLLNIDRLSKVYDKHGDRFIKRVLNQDEYAIFLNRNKEVRFLANNFCAKEAVSKAIGTGISKDFTFRDVSILRDTKGAPYIKFSDRISASLAKLGISQCLVSISDEKPFTTAVAILS
jgi:holo-[acyl-carrier protein] synthase